MEWWRRQIPSSIASGTVKTRHIVFLYAALFISASVFSVIATRGIALPARTIYQDLIGHAGSAFLLALVVLVVPEGWGVQVDRLGKTWGSISSKVPGHAAWGNPLIVARGSIGLGSFKARGANWVDRRRLGQDR